MDPDWQQHQVQRRRTAIKRGERVGGGGWQRIRALLKRE